MNVKHRALTSAVIITLLFSLQGIQLTNHPLINYQVAENTQVNTQTYWLNLAANAWQYFQVGNGVNSATGLDGGDLTYPYFTDWDLGIYIQAVINAEKLGLISSNGTYGADWRFDKVLTFLETRPLTSDNQPYAWYCTSNGQNRGDTAQVATDTGNLLVSLKNLETYQPNLASQINYVVYNRTNYEPESEAVECPSQLS